MFDLLVAELVRCAAVGALKVDPRIAAELILSANVGLALNQIATPSLFDDPTVSHLMRDAVFARVLGRPSTADEGDGLRSVALRLRAQLDLNGTEALEPVETALLVRWLDRIAAPGRDDTT
ncbi:hypothetical protein OOK06_31145 [Streptomyces sp. NBC_00340]|uniref:hypothetical protein n=1 Tax=Streptomyces sp. NBC_00340 TaxID=2975716 RepID=UPI002250FBC4|nr:hypothetical protein [Streptomyces sp. NBC_00340]MCX5136524.1 hypothetical protein [Streptomyces sp. NBC_00340]